EFGRTPKHADVIGVGHDVALVGTIIHALGEGIGSAELKALAEAAAPIDLEGVVNGVGDVIGFTDGAETQVGANRIDIHGWVGGPFCGGWLIDVGLALLVQATVPDVGNAEYGTPRQLALDSSVPGPGLGIFEGFALGGDNERNG